MLRFTSFQRFTTIAARSLATVSRNAVPLTSSLQLHSPISSTLSKVKSLQSAWFGQPQWVPLMDPVQKTESSLVEDLDVDNTLYMDSVLRKRRLKMKKHKLRKRRRLQRSLKKRLGKI